MTYREEKYLLETTRENNKMLKEIIKYINYTISQASDENMDDFGRNILANLISNNIKKQYMKYFTMNELTYSATANLKKIKNVPKIINVI